MPSRFHWSDQMSVGKSALDAQHKKLVTQLQRTVDAVTFSASTDEVSRALTFLERYMQTHFSYEENYMRQRAYALFDEHVKVHRQLTNEFRDLKCLGTSGAVSTTWLDAFYAFGDSMMRHMHHEDREYHATLGEKVEV